MSTSLVNRPGTLRPLLALVWPVLIEQMLAMLVGFSDMLLAGHYLGRPHLAAMTMLSYGLWAAENMFAFVAIGAMALIARYAGAGNPQGANRVCNQSFVAGGILAVAVTTLGIAFGPHLVAAMQLEGEAARLATRYLYWTLPMLPMMMLEAIGIACLRGTGDMVMALVARALVNVIDIALSWSLLLGVGPLPELGWDGLAIGTAAGYGLGGLLPLAVLVRGQGGLQVRWALLRPDWQLIRRILRIGVPGGIDIMSMIGCQLIFVGLINTLGELAAAAHGVAIRIESLAYLPGTAFQVAAATLAGQYLGAGDYRRATRSVLVACLTGGAVMAAAGLTFFFGAESLVPLFVRTSQADVISTTAPLLRIISVAMVPLALVMVLTGALRGAGDTRWPLLFSLIGFLVIRMPAAYLLAYVWGWGIQGAWYAMVIDLVVRCAMVMYRFWHGGWQRIEV